MREAAREMTATCLILELSQELEEVAVELAGNIGTMAAGLVGSVAPGASVAWGHSAEPCPTPHLQHKYAAC